MKPAPGLPSLSPSPVMVAVGVAVVATLVFLSLLAAVIIRRRASAGRADISPIEEGHDSPTAGGDLSLMETTDLSAGASNLPSTSGKPSTGGKPTVSATDLKQATAAEIQDAGHDLPIVGLCSPPLLEGSNVTTFYRGSFQGAKNRGDQWLARNALSSSEASSAAVQLNRFIKEKNYYSMEI